MTNQQNKELSGGYYTVVYQGIAAGDEAKNLGMHPKACAMSWSHALDERDKYKALAAPQPVAASPSIVPSDEQIIQLARDNGIPIHTGKTAIKFARLLLTTTSNAGEAKQGDKGVVSGADRTTSGSVGQP